MNHPKCKCFQPDLDCNNDPWDPRCGNTQWNLKNLNKRFKKNNKKSNVYINIYL